MNDLDHRCGDGSLKNIFMFRLGKVNQNRLIVLSMYANIANPMKMMLDDTCNDVAAEQPQIPLLEDTSWIIF